VQPLNLNEIIEGCQSNDRDCQKALYDKYAATMLGVCQRFARHNQEAEDMLHDGFIQVFENIDQYNRLGSFGSWVRRLMINTCLNHIRRFSYQKELIGIEEMQMARVDPEVMQQFSEKELLKMIDKLPLGYKHVFNLYAIEGYNHREIAAMLGIEEGTSRSQLLKARKLLKKFISNALSTLI